MKKKLVLLLLSIILTLTACGAEATSTEQQESEPTKEVVSEDQITESDDTKTEDVQKEDSNSEDLSELEAIGAVEVEKNLFDVELTIPSDFIGDTTQEELDTLASEKGYKSITLNSDGSATYVMTKSQHKDMIAEMATTINDALAEMIGSEDYPNFTEVKANDNFTEFTITTKSTELDFAESFSTLVFYMYGGMYNIFNGTPVENVSVTFINADSGEVISTANSADAGQ